MSYIVHYTEFLKKYRNMTDSEKIVFSFERIDSLGAKTRAEYFGKNMYLIRRHTNILVRERIGTSSQFHWFNRITTYDIFIHPIRAFDQMIVNNFNWLEQEALSTQHLGVDSWVLFNVKHVYLASDSFFLVKNIDKQWLPSTYFDYYIQRGNATQPDYIFYMGTDESKEGIWEYNRQEKFWLKVLDA